MCNIYFALEKYIVVLQCMTPPSIQLLKSQASEIFQNPAFLLSVTLSPTGSLPTAPGIPFPDHGLQGPVWPKFYQSLKLHLIHTPLHKLLTLGDLTLCFIVCLLLYTRSFSEGTYFYLFTIVPPRPRSSAWHTKGPQ